MRRVASALASARASATVRGASWVFVGFAARMALQGVTFILLARLVGAGSFGAFAAALGLAGFLSPLVELGAYSFVVKDVTDGTPTARALGNGLLLSTLALPVGMALLVLVKLLVLHEVPWGIVLPVGIAAFVGGRLVNVSHSLGVAHHATWRNAVVEVASGVLQLLALGYVAWGAREADVVTWTRLYALQALLVGAGALAWAVHTWGRPTARLDEVLARLRPGVHFALSSSANNASELDKPLLAQLGSLEAAGVYTAAHRFVVVASLPLVALQAALYPRFFAAGDRGNASARALAYRAAAGTAAIAALMIGALWLVAPALPRLFGAEYEGTSGVVRLLSFQVLLLGLMFPFADALTGSGRHPTRTKIQIASQLCSVALYYLLIPRLGWRGAAAGALAGQALVCIGAFVALQRDPGGAPTPSPPEAEPAPPSRGVA